MDPPDPVDAIKFRMEQAGLSVKDMGSMIGQPNRVYEVLGRKRPLTLRMIRRLHKELGIPAEVLIAGGAERFALAA
jgi:HTH-type transcriptional regulator/antitoxin HigA